MPELPEVERYRQLAEARALRRPIAAVRADDAWYLKRGLDAGTVVSVLLGASFVAARRIGKLLLLDTDTDPDTDTDTAADTAADTGTGTGPGGAAGATVGLRFGMSGRLVVDGNAGVGDLLYTTNRDDEHWDRFVVRFADGGELRMRDPRRLGGVELNPDEGGWGATRRRSPCHSSALRSAPAGRRSRRA